MAELTEIAALLRQNDDFLIITHIRPDGDAQGSAAALCYALRRMGKRAFLFPNPQTTAKYRDMVTPFFAPEAFVPAYRVAVDTASDSMFSMGYTGRADMCIDHHGSNTGYAGVTLCRPEKASCGEIILELCKELLGGIDRALADMLYIAVSTDTGCFLYGNTRPDTHRAAAELMEAGADALRINVKFFRKLSAARIALESMMYASMRQYENGFVTVMTVTLEMMENARATEDDCEDLASVAGRVEGSRVHITLRELSPGVTKISVRTGAEVNASDVCAKFGGGGHAMAAGCTVDRVPEEARELIVAALREVTA